MNQLVPITTHEFPALVAAAGEHAHIRFVEFFTANIRNRNTRRAYAQAVAEFLAWCEHHRVPSITAVQPVHVAGYIDELTRARSAPTAKQRLSAIRHLFDQVMPVNPASSVRGPSHVVKRGKTPVLAPEEARRVLDAIDVSTHAGLRNRALIALMVFSFARIGAAVAMKVEDVFVQNRRLWVRLREKGGKRHEMPCHHNLETYLHAYLDGSGISADPKGPLFRTIRRTTGQLTKTLLPQSNAHAMIRRRAAGAGIKTQVRNHTFRATGITAYLKNGGSLENAAAMANHASTRTTQLYDRRRDEVEPQRGGADFDMSCHSMTSNLPASILGTCWICGEVADSDEHKFKRSDMVTRYGRSWPPAEQPFVFRGDGRPARIQGPNSGPTLYRDMLCMACNNARTKPFDLAYERLSTWVLSESAALHQRAEIDFTEVFGNSYVEETLKLLCYFVKSLGCRIADSGVAPPPALCRILTTTGITDTMPFRVTFGINESWRRIDPSGRILGKGELFCWPDGGSEPGFSWSETVGYFEIYHWYNVVWNPFPFGGDVMSGPLRTVTLGRRDQGDPANPLDA